ncbi:hypothetical protein Ddye_013560 [Dipteronia dyeriana]|uniref:BHLH domain-containing protein n=1 Tax=Dipteronia dyeriana TaxID=168575 RepID=A0AAD9X6I1_9ROSI|nr:hypothetical protein Ddye_013560 [Dipteronia dyeriana]
MFPPAPPSDEYFFINHFINPRQEDFIQQDLILTNINYSQGRRSNINDCEKKILHKEIERQRRRHMSKLNASLRSLLHLDSIKGKLSVSDHIHEAEKYITHMKKNIQDLSVKRDKLIKNLPDSDNQVLDHGNTSSENCLVNCTLSVHPYCGGVGIVVGGDLRGESFLLSRVLEVVVDQGLDVVRCVYHQTDEGIFHTIQSKVGDPTVVDLHGMQQKLNYVIMSTGYNTE